MLQYNDYILHSQMSQLHARDLVTQLYKKRHIKLFPFLHSRLAAFWFLLSLAGFTATQCTGPHPIAAADAHLLPTTSSILISRTTWVSIFTVSSLKLSALSFFSGATVQSPGGPHQGNVLLTSLLHFLWLSSFFIFNLSPLTNRTYPQLTEWGTSVLLTATTS